MKVTSEERQDLVNHAILLKVMSDYYLDAYKAMLAEYAAVAYETSKMPKGDASDIGEITVVYNKPTDDEIVPAFRVVDLDALKADTDEDFAEYIVTWLGGHMPMIAEDFFNEVGAIPDGCEVTEQVVPGKPKSVKYFKAVPDKGFRKAATEALAAQTAMMLDGIRGQLGE